MNTIERALQAISKPSRGKNGTRFAVAFHPLLFGLGGMQALLLLQAFAPAFEMKAVALCGVGLFMFTYAVRHLGQQTDVDRAAHHCALEAAQAVAPLAFFSFDFATRQLEWSDGMARLLGVRPQTWWGAWRACLTALTDEDRGWAVPYVRTELDRTGKADLFARLNNGEEIVCRVRLQLMRDRNGRPLRLVGVCVDLTEPMRQAGETLDSLEVVSGVQRSREVMFSSLSHEIRTPLTGILGFTEIMLEEASEEHREFLGSIQRNGFRLLDTLTSLMELARLEGRMVTNEAREHDLVQATEVALRRYAGKAAEKGLTVCFASPHREVPSVVDGGHLARVLDHILGNAIKFTHTGHVRVEVDLDGAWAAVRVSDTGVGIDPEFLPHLFQAFRQESDGLDRTFEGSGVGLAVCHHLVALMGGSITVESEKDQGSTFTVRLPLALHATTGAPAYSPGRARPSSPLKLVTYAVRQEEPAPATGVPAVVETGGSAIADRSPRWVGEP